MSSPSAICEVERIDRGRPSCPGRCVSPARSARQPSLDLQVGACRHVVVSPVAPLEPLDRRAELGAQPRCAAASPRRAASSPSSAAPTIGGESVTCADDAGPIDLGRPRSIAASKRSSRARKSPPPSMTSTASPVSPRRSSATRASATTSSARRSTISAATASVGRLGEDERARARSPTRTGSRDDGSPRRAATGCRSPKWAGTARSSDVRGPRPSSLRAAALTRGEPDVVAAAPVAGDRAERREAHLAAVRADADAVDAGAAHDRDAPAARRCRRGAPRTCRSRRSSVAAQPAGRRALRASSPSSAGKSTPASRNTPTSPRRGVVARRRPRCATASSSSAVEHVQAPARGRGGAASSAARARARAARRRRGASARSVFELPPSTASTSAVAHRSAPGARERGRCARRPRAALEQLVGGLPLADQRVREERLARVDRVAAERGARPRAARRPRRAGRGRAARARAAPAAAARRRRPRSRAGTSTTSSSASPASVPSLRTSTTCTSPVPAASEAIEAGRRLAVERAAALLEQRRLLGDLRIAVELEQLALDLGHRGRARRPAALLGEHLVVGVEVAEVVRRDRAELVEQPPRQPDVARRARRRARRAARAARPRRRRARRGST